VEKERKRKNMFFSTLVLRKRSEACNDAMQYSICFLIINLDITTKPRRRRRRRRSNSIKNNQQQRNNIK
jgi:hypothetical protein